MRTAPSPRHQLHDGPILYPSRPQPFPSQFAGEPAIEHDNWHLPDNITTEMALSKVCTVCQRMLKHLVDGTFAPNTLGEVRIDHQANFSDLKEAADDSCGLCWPVYKLIQLKDRIPAKKANGDGYASSARNGMEARTYLAPVRTRLDTQIAPREEGVAKFVLRYGGNGHYVPLLGLGVEDRGGSTQTILGRPVSPEPELALARAWLQQCFEKHGDCSTERPVELPTRLIAVGEENVKEPHLSYTAGQKGRYLTLSHQWGEPSSSITRTYTSNLEEMLVEIPLSSMAQNFKDAITVTRTLGYQYLWIDSFCIVQDSTEDWQRECSKMASIYENADLTIAASYASSSTVGFLESRAPFYWRYTDTSHRSEVVDDFPGLVLQIGEAQVGLFRRTTSPFLEEDHNSSPLMRRAWVVQERLLSARTLSFNLDQMTFHCQRCIWHESLRHPSHRKVIDNHWDGQMLDTSLMTLRTLKGATGTDTNGVMRHWYNVVEKYSACEITKGDDRLPALSGLASRVAGQLGLVYSAGLWEGDLLRGLTWYCVSIEPGTKLAKFESTMYTPSWSWAGPQRPVRFVRTMNDGLDVEDAQVRGMEMVPSGFDPFGNVAVGRITLEGHMRPLLSRPSGYGPPNTYWPGDSDKALPTSNMFCLDEAHASSSRFTADAEVMCLLLGSTWQECSCYDCTGAVHEKGEPHRDISSLYDALLLEAVSDMPDSYRRVGLLTKWVDSGMEPDTSTNRFLQWLKQAERYTAHIL